MWVGHAYYAKMDACVGIPCPLLRVERCCQAKQDLCASFMACLTEATGPVATRLAAGWQATVAQALQYDSATLLSTQHHHHIVVLKEYQTWLQEPAAAWQ